MNATVAVPANSASAGSFSGLAKILSQSKLLDEKQLGELVQLSTSSSEPLIRVVAKQYPLLSSGLAERIANAMDLPFVDLLSFSREAMPSELIEDSKPMLQLRAVPVFVRGPKVFVATSDPTNIQGLDFFTHKAGKRMELLVIDDAQIEKFINAVAGDLEVSKDLENEANIQFSADTESTEDDLAEGEDNPVVKFVTGVLLSAIRKGASDIHFEPFEKFYRVRLRVDGVLAEVTRPPVGWGNRIASRIKVISSLDISEKRKPQDGRMKLQVTGARAIDFRVSTLPTMYGEKIVMRILDPTAASLGIDALGYEPEERERLLHAIQRPYGMVLVTGPTGSGKTVSLYTCLNILNKDEINISTAEDPCEIQLPGINQVNVNPAAGLTFASALKSFLRQDPDIIMVGEIRDEETAEISVKAAQTGHMVLATLHTNDAPKTISRLVEIGVKPYNVASAVILITAQRLARKLCQHCKIEETGLTPEVLVANAMTADEASGVYSRWKPYRANKDGCESCTAGYKGRVGIYQVMPITESIQALVMRGADSMEIAAQSLKDGVRDLRQSALLKYRKGLTSMDEVLSVTNE